MRKIRVLAVVIGLCPTFFSCGTGRKDSKKIVAPVDADDSSSPENLCKKSGGTFEGGICKAPSEEPKNSPAGAETNRKLTGLLSSSPGLIWEANESTCDEQENNKWDKCAGIDALLPLASIQNSKSEVTFEIASSCEGLLPTKIEITMIDQSHPEKGPKMNNSMAFGAGASRFQWTTIAESDENLALTLRLDTSDLFATYKSGCKIELISNIATKK